MLGMDGAFHYNSTSDSYRPTVHNSKTSKTGMNAGGRYCK